MLQEMCRCSRRLYRCPAAHASALAHLLPDALPPHLRPLLQLVGIENIGVQVRSAEGNSSRAGLG